MNFVSVFQSFVGCILFFSNIKSYLCLDSTDESTPLNREGAMNKPPSGSEHNVSRGQMDLASRSLGSAMFPDEDTEEGIFHMEVLLAVQRWFSSQGWPGGQFPIIIPHSLRWWAQTICSCCKIWKTLYYKDVNLNIFSHSQCPVYTLLKWYPPKKIGNWKVLLNCED